MGELTERVKLSLLVNGDGIVDNFRNNSLYFFEKYQKSDDLVKNIKVEDIFPGGFYFFHYLDDSNWMQFSPVFVADYKKFSNKIVLFCVNFNFIPLEIRVMIFDKYITEEDFEKDNYLVVDYEGMYSELQRLGFEYALMEFNSIQIKFVHKIKLDLVPRFLYAQHPKNVYDPKKLIQIWEAKIGSRNERHQEMMLSTISDFYDINKEISDKYDVLTEHIQRIRRSIKKYGS
jgi:hypothetical protein